MERKLTEILLNWTNAGYFCDAHACFFTATSRSGEDVSLKDRSCEGGCCHEAQNANKPICPYSKRRPTQGLRNLNFLPQVKSAAGITGQPQIWPGTAHANTTKTQKKMYAPCGVHNCDLIRTCDSLTDIPVQDQTQ
jgi:hypothetical protein